MKSGYRVIFHVDMDAFYASVEQRDNPSLRGRPVIVGARPDQRGVVCAASYEARQFGVRSAMPSAVAGRRCPEAVFLRPRMALYRMESKKVMAILRRFSARMEQVSVDEAYLDLSEQVDGNSPDDALQRSVHVGRALKSSIREAC